MQQRCIFSVPVVFPQSCIFSSLKACESYCSKYVDFLHAVHLAHSCIFLSLKAFVRPYSSMSTSLMLYLCGNFLANDVLSQRVRVWGGDLLVRRIQSSRAAEFFHRISRAQRAAWHFFLAHYRMSWTCRRYVRWRHPAMHVLASGRALWNRRWPDERFGTSARPATKALWNEAVAEDFWRFGCGRTAG